LETEIENLNFYGGKTETFEVLGIEKE